MIKQFMVRKIYESIPQHRFFDETNGLNFAVVLPYGDLYIHCHGEAMIESVFKNKDKYYDVTEYIESYICGADDKLNTARNIKEGAENFYNNIQRGKAPNSKRR